MNRHYDEEALLEYVEGTSALSEEIAAHVTSCSDTDMIGATS